MEDTFYELEKEYEFDKYVWLRESLDSDKIICKLEIVEIIDKNIFLVDRILLSGERIDSILVDSSGKIKRRI